MNEMSENRLYFGSGWYWFGYEPGYRSSADGGGAGMKVVGMESLMRALFFRVICVTDLFHSMASFSFQDPPTKDLLYLAPNGFRW